MDITTEDIEFMRRAIELALPAEKESNLPVGAVMTTYSEIIIEGRSAIWVPHFDATWHTEMEALRTVPQGLRFTSTEISLYTILEP